VCDCASEVEIGRQGGRETQPLTERERVGEGKSVDVGGRGSVKEKKARETPPHEGHK